MNTLRRLLYREIVVSVAFVTVAFLALFYFIDVVEDLDEVGKRGRTVWHVAQAALYELPGHFYELFPIAVLIGTIYALSRLAQSSEFTILRTSGLGPGRALRMLALLGVGFGTLNFMVGDLAAPASERAAVRLKSQFSGGLRVGGAGAWLKEKRTDPQGERSWSVNVGAMAPSGLLEELLLLEFDADGRLRTRIAAPQARVEEDGSWTLRQAAVMQWPVPGTDNPQVLQQLHAELKWTTTLRADVVAAAVLPLSTMTTLELYRYSMHLSDQEQTAQRHLIRFWKKALYPLACLVMVALSLPFAYLHARAGGVSLKVFGGIMLGITFVLLNNLAGHIGLLREWTPWAAAALPSLLFLLMSMAAFAWLVRYR